jgi:hypothetical protein
MKSTDPLGTIGGLPSIASEMPGETCQRTAENRLPPVPPGHPRAERPQRGKTAFSAIPGLLGQGWPSPKSDASEGMRGGPCSLLGVLGALRRRRPLDCPQRRTGFVRAFGGTGMPWENASEMWQERPGRCKLAPMHLTEITDHGRAILRSAKRFHCIASLAQSGRD